MNQYIVTAWTTSTLLVGQSDVELVGANILIGIYNGETEEEAKLKASEDKYIPFEDLEASPIDASSPSVQPETKEKSYLVDVTWRVGKEVTITAANREEAEKKAYDISATEGLYVDDSFTVHNIEELDEEE